MVDSFDNIPIILYKRIYQISRKNCVLIYDLLWYHYKNEKYHHHIFVHVQFESNEFWMTINKNIGDKI